MKNLTSLGAAGFFGVDFYIVGETRILGNNQTVYTYSPGKAAITATEANAQIRMPKCRVLAIYGRNSTLSSHLDVLQEAGLITQERKRGRYLITIPGRLAVKMAYQIADRIGRSGRHG